MPFPADFTAQQQYRMKIADAELHSAAKTFIDSLTRLQEARAAFIGQGLTSLWPTNDTDWVHRDQEASTKGEQNDLSNAILHATAVLQNSGTAPITSAQAAVIWQRYISTF